MLGLESSKCGLMSSLMRWKRLIWPHGVSQLPKLLASLSEAVASDGKRLFRRGTLCHVVFR